MMLVMDMIRPFPSRLKARNGKLSPILNLEVVRRCFHHSTIPLIPASSEAIFGPVESRAQPSLSYDVLFISLDPSTSNTFASQQAGDCKSPNNAELGLAWL